MATTIIQGLPFSTTRAAVAISDNIHAIIHEMRFSGTAFACHSLPSMVTTLRVTLSICHKPPDGQHLAMEQLKSPKECDSPTFLVSWLLACWRVYNHPRDAFLNYCVCSC